MLAHLRLHVGGVVAADRVMVGDRAAGGDDRLAGGALDLAPLLELGALAGPGDEGEVERGAVGVGVGEVAEDEARRALAGERVADRRRRPRGAGSRAATRCARSRASRPSPPSPSACRAGRGPGSGRAPRSARPTGQVGGAARAQRPHRERAAAGDRLLVALVADDHQAAAARGGAGRGSRRRARRRGRAGPRGPARPRSPPRRRRGSRPGRPGPCASERTISAPASKLSAIQAS